METKAQAGACRRRQRLCGLKETPIKPHKQNRGAGGWFAGSSGWILHLQGSPWAEPGVRDAEKRVGIEEPPIKPSLPESAGGAKWRNARWLFLSVLIVSRCALLAAKILVVCECISFHR